MSNENDGKRNSNTGNLGGSSNPLDYRGDDSGEKGGSRMKNAQTNPKPFTERPGSDPG